MARLKFVSRDESTSPVRIRRKDAESIARQLVAVMRKTARPYTLFIGAQGESLMTPAFGKRVRAWVEKWPKSLCGTYTPEAKADEVIGDIMGMDS